MAYSSWIYVHVRGALAFWATKAGLIAWQWRVWLQQQKLMKIIGDREREEKLNSSSQSHDELSVSKAATEKNNSKMMAKKMPICNSWNLMRSNLLIFSRPLKVQKIVHQTSKGIIHFPHRELFSLTNQTRKHKH